MYRQSSVFIDPMVSHRIIAPEMRVPIGPPRYTRASMEVVWPAVDATPPMWHRCGVFPLYASPQPCPAVSKEVSLPLNWVDHPVCS